MSAISFDGAFKIQGITILLQQLHCSYSSDGRSGTWKPPLVKSSFYLADNDRKDISPPTLVSSSIKSIID
ncbi:hypothetical protein RND71_026641 [Anisodus tanguticus]|uniref:Uncharacterized protein n=1 Tax=Anisodus tanguticus TaxID=243964 RepID=A0AAE1RNR3_9SOLA|nr:hypothetical protein RND71_026641 [Anisodus tanguticus]